MTTEQNSILIKNGRVLDPANNRDETADILIQNGKIAFVGKKKGLSSSLEPDGETIDAKGLIVAPGFFDMHTHLREPGFEYKETIKTGTEAAAKGGFTSIACMANTSPVNDNASVTNYILEKARTEGFVNVFPIGAATKNLEGKELAEIGEMKEAGVVAISDDGMPIMDANLFRRALEYASMFGLPLIEHCEDHHLSKGGVMNESKVSTVLGLGGIPTLSEDIMVARNILIAEYLGAHVHIAHASTAGSIRMVREGKKRGLRITCEVTPHHFSLTHEAVKGYQTHAKMSPPLRSEQDREALWEGLADGTVDAIATDHAPHNRAETEVEFDLAPNGVIGMETALMLSYELVEKGVIDLNRMVELLTIGPSRLLRVDKGTLSEGADADVVIFDTNLEWSIEVHQFRSKSRNTPFKDQKGKGLVRYTIVGGKTVYPFTDPSN